MLHSVDAEKLFTQILSLQDEGQNHNVDEPFSAYLPGETERCLVEQGGRCWEILVRILHVRRYARNRSHSRGRTRARSYLFLEGIYCKIVTKMKENFERRI